VTTGCEVDVDGPDVVVVVFEAWVQPARARRMGRAAVALPIHFLSVR
jgi:hypothetical protein